jgi:pyruvate/2-oxoglutarate dehydrogenase complex dihydrolipoamide acyltransferase (E2) component
MVVCTGQVEEKAVVINHLVEVRPIINAVFTFDHRFGDAALVIKFNKILREYVEDPENFNIDNFPDSTPYSNEYVKNKKEL